MQTDALAYDETPLDLLSKSLPKGFWQTHHDTTTYFNRRRADGLPHGEAFVGSFEYAALIYRLTGMSRAAKHRANMVADQQAKENTGVLYLNVLPAWSEYGGSEEGGWYYTAYGEPIASIPYLDDEGSIRRPSLSYLRARRLADKFLEAHNRYDGAPGGGCGEPDLHEWNPDDQGMTWKTTEGAPFDADRWQRPHYE